MRKLEPRDVALILHSMLAEQLSRERGSYFPVRAYLDAATPLSRPPFELDSLGLVRFASEASEFFGLHHSGLDEYLLRHPDLKSWRNIVLDGLDSHAGGLTFFTSGTTGEPKPVHHDPGRIEREVRFLAETLFRGRRKVVTAARLHHIYGFLYGIALPRFLGRPVEPLEIMPSRRLVEEAVPGSLVVATPALYRQLDLLPARFGPDVQVVSSTEALDRVTWQALEARGVERVHEIYGSSETLGVGHRDGPDEPFQLFASADETTLERLQDHLEWVDDRRFRLRGRKDGAVKVRGYKRYPGAAS